ncbi:MAG TPA: Dabb family protein [Acidimicrobiales bacterium]|nr:Dabb family protein [Acidimicrobiales bacterium]
MITHVVLFRLADPVDRDEVIARVEAMRDRIPVLQSLQVGADVIDPARPNQVALVTAFDSVPDLDTYQAHPLHRELVEWMNDHGVVRSVVDFET